jgi:glycosyltransferase involved in cell wall biosynthesis
MGITDKVYLLEHGLNEDLVYPIDKTEARKSLQLNPDDFIVLNTNRNTHRKGIDLTISAFLIFLKNNNCNPDIKLFLNMDFHNKTTYDIDMIVKTESQRLQLDPIKVWNHIYRFKNGGSVTDQLVNTLYNATDVGINTCYGEGFGLCNFEHGCVGRAQVMTKTGALNDIFENLPCKLIQPITNIYVPLSLDSHGGIWDIGHPKHFAAALHYYYHNQDICKKDGQILMQQLPSRYNWNVILKTFYESHILDFTNIFTQSEIKTII